MILTCSHRDCILGQLLIVISQFFFSSGEYSTPLAASGFHATIFILSSRPPTWSLQPSLNLFRSRSMLHVKTATCHHKMSNFCAIPGGTRIEPVRATPIRQHIIQRTSSHVAVISSSKSQPGECAQKICAVGQILCPCNAGPHV